MTIPGNALAKPITIRQLELRRGVSLFRRPSEPYGCHKEILVNPQAVHKAPCHFILCGGKPLDSRLPEQIHGHVMILGNAKAILIALAQLTLCSGKPLSRGLLEQFHCGGIILPDTKSVFVPTSKTQLRVGVSLVGSVPDPFHRRLPIPLDIYTAKYGILLISSILFFRQLHDRLLLLLSNTRYNVLGKRKSSN